VYQALYGPEGSVIFDYPETQLEAVTGSVKHRRT